jgi:hypothetical protein
MRTVFAILSVTTLALVACKGEDKPTVTTSATISAVPTTGSPTIATVTATVATTQAAAPIAPSADMTAFMAMLDGKDDSARKALKKYATKGLENDDLGMYKLTTPKVTKSEKVGELQCYTMESTAGVMTHTTQTCWDAKGKIAKITDTSS